MGSCHGSTTHGIAQAGTGPTGSMDSSTGSVGCCPSVVSTAIPDAPSPPSAARDCTAGGCAAAAGGARPKQNWCHAVQSLFDGRRTRSYSPASSVLHTRQQLVLDCTALIYVQQTSACDCGTVQAFDARNL